MYIQSNVYKTRERLLAKVEILSHLTSTQLARLSEALVTRKYKDEHAFGSWIAGFFLIFTVFQEFYEIVG